MTKDDIRQLPRRALIDQALVCLTEIERRIGGVSDLPELIERLVQFGRQFDNIPCANCSVIYDRHPIYGPGCEGFREPITPQTQA